MGTGFHRFSGYDITFDNEVQAISLLALPDYIVPFVIVAGLDGIADLLLLVGVHLLEEFHLLEEILIFLAFLHRGVLHNVVKALAVER